MDKSHASGRHMSKQLRTLRVAGLDLTSAVGLNQDVLLKIEQSVITHLRSGQASDHSE